MLFVLAAGELSGDNLGASLIQSLKSYYPQAKFVGIAGPKMQEAGCESLFPMETLSVMGLTEVLKHLPAILKVRKGLLEFCLREKPAVFIGIDAPDFNLGVAKKLKANGIKTVHYVSPSIWAWRENRIHTIKQATDLVLCLLPFETKIYDKHQHRAQFVGHPQADTALLEPDQLQARTQLGVTLAGKYLAILPGSRRQELKALLPPFLQTAKLCKQQLPELQFILPLARESLRDELAPYAQQLSDLHVKVIIGQGTVTMAAADVVLLASGTATLEAMLCKRPMVVAYRLSWFTHWLAQYLVKVKYIALPNLLADFEVVPEFIQNSVIPKNMASAIMKYFTDDAERIKLKQRFTEMHQLLKRNASEQAAAAIHRLIG